MSNSTDPPTNQAARFTEVRQQPVTDDPAITGQLESTWKLSLPTEMPPRPAEGHATEGDGDDEGAFALLSHVQFAPVDEEQLPAGATRQVELHIDGPSVLLGSVRWIGTTSPLSVSLLLDGANLATGTGHSTAGNRGGSSLRARTTDGGHATLSVTNTSGATVMVRIVLGALDALLETR